MGFNDKSIIHSGYFGNSKENINIVENFVKLEDLKKIQNFCNNLKNFRSIPGDVWDNRVCGTDMIRELSPEIINILSIYQEKVKNIVEETFDVLVGPNSPYIVVWRVGDGQAPHADKELPDGTPNMYPGNDIASLIYINDEYSGGEVYFPNQGIQLKPTPGSLVFFPGDKEYLHGVHQITDGIRFTSPAFWNIKQIIKNS